MNFNRRLTEPTARLEQKSPSKMTLPTSSAHFGQSLYRKSKENQKLRCDHDLHRRRQLVLNSQHQHEQHHREPLPARAPQSFQSW